METNEQKLPLGLFKQACMKIDSFVTDIHEITEDANIDDDNKETLTRLAEMAASIEASLINIVRSEMDEEEFINENITMDEIEEYPGTIKDLLDEPI